MGLVLLPSLLLELPLLLLPLLSHLLTPLGLQLQLLELQLLQSLGPLGSKRLWTGLSLRTPLLLLLLLLLLQLSQMLTDRLLYPKVIYLLQLQVAIPLL